MRHDEGRIAGVGGFQLYWQSWLPPVANGVTIVLVHGMAEHSGRYGNVVDALGPLGYSVWALDHRGHGRSDGQRAHVDRFSDYVADLESFRLMVEENTGGHQVLLGHSMGGTISLAHAVAHPGSFDGLVLSSPAVGAEAPRALVAVGRVISRFVPEFGIRTLDSSGVSRDPDVVTAYETDPLVHRGKFSARLGAEMLDTMAGFAATVPALNIPTLVLAGTADTIVDVQAIRSLFPLIGSDDKTLRIQEGLAHELFNEPEHADVLGEVAGWLGDRFLS